MGLIFIYFIGRAFFTLAERYHKSKWLYAILGVVMYYFATFLTGAVAGILDALFSWDLEQFPDLVLGLFFVPFGLAASVGFYYFLKWLWGKKSSPSSDEEILDISTLPV